MGDEMREPARLPAVYDDDLDQLVESLGLAADLGAGTLRCRLCSDVVTRESLAALFPAHGNVYVVCSRPECIQLLVRQRDESRNG